MKNLGYKEETTVQSGDIRQYFEIIKEGKFKDIAREMRGYSNTSEIFLIMLKSENALNFPIVYESRSFMVYKIPKD